MNDIVNKFLLARDKFMLEMHLRQLGFTYSACGPFTKSTKRIQKLKQTGHSICNCKNELDKLCFQHDMAYRDFKDLQKRTAADKVLRYKTFILLKIPNMMGIKESWTLWFINSLIKRLKAVVSHFQINLLSNLHLKMNNYLMNFINPLLKNLKKGKYIQHLETIFGL